MIDKIKQFYNESNLKINDLPFVSDIEKAGGEIFMVGGSTRDELLGKESKDLDILIRGISIDKMNSILKKYGTVNLVGQKFGVIKWKEFGSNEDIDIAIPRTEIKTGPNRTDFEVSSDPMLPLEHDLYRRDFSFNAISKKLNGEMIDPYNGRLDIKNKIIRMINPNSFDPVVGDELRMLRGVQFSSRFSFKIEEKTLEAMRKFALTITKTSKERVLEELKKMLKGDKNLPLGISYLIRTKLFQYIFKFKNIHFSLREFLKVNVFSELLFLLSFGNGIENLGDYLKKVLMIENSTEKEINSLNHLFLNSGISDIAKRRMIISECLKSSQIIYESKLIPGDWKVLIKEFKNGMYPKNINELKINGNELMNLGYQGKAISEITKKLLLAIYSDEIQNDKNQILRFLGR